LALLEGAGPIWQLGYSIIEMCIIWAPLVGDYGKQKTVDLVGIIFQMGFLKLVL
jgi:hypothetical protein